MKSIIEWIIFCGIATLIYLSWVGLELLLGDFHSSSADSVMAIIMIGLIYEKIKHRITIK